MMYYFNVTKRVPNWQNLETIKTRRTLSVTPETTLICNNYKVLIEDNLSCNIHRMTVIYPIMNLTKNLIYVFYIIDNAFNDL